jgi:mersacidin/lichenicidin family type 2 lantibiotic
MAESQSLEADGEYAVRQIIRAWKDEEFRRSLPNDVMELLPENPAGVIDLIAAELELAPRPSDLPPTYETVCSEGWRCLSKTKC